jgi:tripartite-type tricarboxylate transporter receptor subunit TctC
MMRSMQWGAALFRQLARGACALLALSACLSIAAEAWPARPMRIIVPAPPGGGTDGLARLIAENLSTALKQPVLIDNRPGASGVIGSDAVAKAAPDGYTILMIVTGHTVNPALIKALPYDTLRDFTAITQITTSPLVLVGATRPDVKNAKDLMELAKRDPRALTFAYFESSSRLATELFRLSSGIAMTQVPYKGTAQAMSDLIGGHVGFSFITIPPILAHQKAGKVSILGVTGDRRTALAPDTATLGEQGFKAVNASIWYGFVAPAGTPTPILGRLREETMKALEPAEARRRLQAWGMELVGSTPEAFDAFLHAQVKQWKETAQAAGIEAE